MTKDQLKEKLRDLMGRTAPLTEREALEAAVDVASDWEMRLKELEDED